MMPHLSAFEAEGLVKRFGRTTAVRLLEDFGPTGAADRRCGTYSGGMRRRLDLAASLVGRPDVIFLDEPTTGLDPAKREDVWNIVRRLVADGVTVLLTTQYLEEADPARLEEAAAIIAAVAGRPAESPGRGVSSVAVDGDAAFTAIVGRLEAAGIAVTELSLRLPSLDEVFFTLTQ
jgi:oleandomycin transport system ATP-binding protein